MPNKKKILVVEDEVMLEELIKFRLEREGFEVIMAENGNEGLLKALSEKPDLILADIMLPEMDGNQMIKIIRSNSDLKKIPIIAVSARGGEDFTKQTIAAGANDYVVKPFEGVELVKLIKKHLK